MNKALQALKDNNPALFSQFVALLSEDLGLDVRTSAGSLRCPNCQSEFQVALSKPAEATAPARRSRRGAAAPAPKKRRDWNPKPKSLFNLLVQVAKIRRATTGAVSAEFNKAMRSKLKGLSPAEAREVKIKWLNDQIAKNKGSEAAA